MLNLETILLPFGLDLRKRTRLVRHQDTRYDVRRLFKTGFLHFYQSIQRRPIFADAEVLISFIGQPGTLALFVGVYRVVGLFEPADHALPEGFLYPEMEVSGCFRYELLKDDRFDDLVGRLVIDWGTGTRSWVQHFKARDVIEVLPVGYVKAFPGFLDTLLTHSELVEIVRNPVANRDWHQMLRSVAGVYLIVDAVTGKQYVGSAYGQGGLLSRWANYVDTGHGGNVQLRELIAARPNAERNFVYSILQTLPTTLTPQEVIAYESLHKQKLGSRAHGLNSN